MILKSLKLSFSIILFVLFFVNILRSEEIKKIEFFGNDRVPNETILMFSKIDIGDILDEETINQVLIDLYNSKLFPSDENKRLKIFEAGFKKSINFLKNDKTNIYVLQQIPTASKYPYGQYLDLYSNEFNLKKRFLKLSTKEIDYIEETKEINEIFNKDKNYVNVLNTSNVFCDNNRCNIGTIDSIYYSDEYHLTYKGGEKIYDVISHLSFD